MDNVSGVGQVKSRAAKVTDWTSWLLLVLAGMLYLPRAVPVEWLWFDPGPVIVEDAAFGEVPGVGFSREIKRPTRISYKVIIRNSRLQVACEAPESGRFTYRPDAELPPDPDLSWWSDGHCAYLPVGAYIMETCWTAYDRALGLLPPKSVCVDSNVFHIEEA